MKTLRLLVTLLPLLIVGTLAGCSGTTKSPDVSDTIRNSLDQASLKDVSVSQNRDKGVVTLGGHVPSDGDKSHAESIAKSIAGGQAVSNQIGVIPPAAESEAKTVNSDLGNGIEKNLDAAPIPHGLDANGLAQEVMGNEVQAQIHDQSLWSYRELREKNGKKELFEVCQTKSGEINRLVAVDGRPLDKTQRHAEDVRIHSLLIHPDEMQREVRKQRNDTDQARDMMKMFPDAFRFQYDGKQGDLVRLEFAANPNFRPSGHAAQVFYHMKGSLLVDAKQKRLAEISGKLMSEVKFGGGVLGHLDKGGTFWVKQQDLGSGHWEITVLDVQMIGKALFFKTIDVAEKDSYTNFQPVTEGTTLAKRHSFWQKAPTTRARCRPALVAKSLSPVST